jgi:tetratricopeptide (TPR) repeat protein
MKVLADVHFRRGKFTEAISAHGEVLRLDPKSVESLLAIAQAYDQLENHDSAVECYRKVMASGSQPFAAGARRALAEVYFRSGRSAEAILELRAVLQSGDEGAEARFLLGRALEAEARAAHASSSRSEAEKLDTEAVHLLEQAIALDPGHAQAHYVLAAVHRRQGKSDLALRDMESFRRSRQTIPVLDSAASVKAEGVFEARTAVQLARALFTSGDADGARALVEHALKLQPDFAEGLAYQAWMHSRLGRTDEAARIYERILSVEPDHAEALWNLGGILLKSGRAEAGAPLILRAAEIRKSFPDGWELLAKLALEHGTYADRAEEFARNALKGRPSAENHTRFALALYTAGKHQESRQVLLDGLKRYPGDQELRQALHAMEAAGAAGDPGKK